MKLKNFIKELIKISKNNKNSNEAEVLMADNILVVKPIFKNNKVYITDTKNQKTEKLFC